MASRTISDTPGKRKTHYTQYTVVLTPIERMLVEYYSKRYGKDLTEIIRGMIRKYIRADQTFDYQDFRKWAEKSLVAQEDNKDMRDAMKEQLRDFEDKFSADPGKTRPSKAR